MQSPHESLSKIEQIEQAIMQISWLSQRQFMQLLDEERFRLTVPQFHTLLHLHQAEGPCKMTELAELTHQSAASLTGVVDRLLEKELVERTRHERDRRQVMVVVTSKGSHLLSEIKQARNEQMQAALASLGSEHMELFQKMLSHVLEGMVLVLERGDRQRWA
jgi:DNA-binding MarR family transcriptional regulator